MITDGRHIANGTLIRTRVCIIGSGPAGITAAWELQKAGIDVTLIEGSRVYPSSAFLMATINSMARISATNTGRRCCRLKYRLSMVSTVEMYQFVGGKYLNFATRTFDGITIGQSPVNVIVNASLLEINHQQGEVVGLRVASMDTNVSPKKATEFTVRADVYVLACGAVANARQLLLSNAGNENDQVGRYFMCHPLSQSNQVISSNYFLTSDQARLMNGQTPTGKWTDPNGVQVTGRFIPNAEQTRKLGMGRCWFWYVYGQYYFEMAPNPESRITLTDTLDPVFGQRQTRATWQLTDLDEKTYNQTTALYQAAVSKLGGTVSYQPWANVKSQLVVNGHHIGTTRMHTDPKQGVVDANLKVHTLKNLYCAGASVFPSAGISKPNLHDHHALDPVGRLPEEVVGLTAREPKMPLASPWSAAA